MVGDLRVRAVGGERSGKSGRHSELTERPAPAQCPVIGAIVEKPDAVWPRRHVNAPELKGHPPSISLDVRLLSGPEPHKPIVALTGVESLESQPFRTGQDRSTDFLHHSLREHTLDITGNADLENLALDGTLLTGQLVREYVQVSGADLVVLGTHGRGAMLEAIMGSVAKSILATLPCDALVVRGPPR